MRKVRQRNPRSRGFLFHLSEFAFRPVPFVASEAAKRVQYSPGCQGLGQAWQLILRRNLWANIIHPGSLSPGFTQGVSSFLTLNEFKLECGFLFQVTKSARRKGGSPKDRGFPPRQAHVIRAGKAPRYAA
jgi:hypothetical protein